MSYQTTVAVEPEFGSEADQLDKDIPSEVEHSIDALIVNHRENGRKLARSLLRRWRVRMAPEETDSIVDLTLCEAAHRFCPDRGASFMTFFYYHLRGHLVRAVASAANASNIFLAYAQSNNLEIGDWNGPADTAHASPADTRVHKAGPGDLMFFHEMKVNAAGSGKSGIEVGLRYQVCDAEYCLPPRTKVRELTLEISGD